ncbi:endonuclease VII domain-containing protein [Streptomyces sp. RS10V-4]|uniref:endonuclease domain-containing protein n=1 Tax=Streptomyces rhizoryzae TaxID=2932493 RepID=UPI002004A147|nr:endonuclease domain-containing protein [Streptomyces rhizoryzae]MCK7627972.1 endonuclease VII domain-containing protein [Streptomyces rhizoryzae]
MITQKLAVQFLADETANCSIPVAPERFRVERFRLHDVVHFGHVRVPAYKYGNRWKFHEPDVRRAGRTIAELHWDPDDLVDPRLEDRDWPEMDPPFTGWRESIRRTIQGAAWAARRDGGCPCGTSYHPRDETGWALPCGLTPETLIERYGNHDIACTLPIPTLVWSEETWLIPRTLALILDSWEEDERALRAAPQPCSGCGAHGTHLDTWRTSTTAGWKVLCPACATATLRGYRQELNGVTYARVRERGPRAEGYLCSLCTPARPAAAWDHCHDHGFVRGPLCGSCNTMEAHGKDFLAQEGSLQHLLRCIGCRRERTLPTHHRLAALRHHLHSEHGVLGCTWGMRFCVSLDQSDDGAYEGSVRCPTMRHRSAAVRMTTSEVDVFLAGVIEAGLMASW